MDRIDPFARAEQLRRTPGSWIVASVETHMFWPSKAQIVYYRDLEFLLLPATRREVKDLEQAPAIALRTDPHRITQQQGRVEILRFASALTWQEDAKLEIVGWTGGNLPRQMGFHRNRGISQYLNGEFLQAPASDSARAALAFYREGVSLDNPFYAFLSLYKAFSVAIPERTTRGQWLRDHSSKLRDPARQRLQEIESEGHDIGQYIFEQGRNAIAHADREPYVNPDNTDDSFRLRKDVPVMSQFARVAIEERCGVKTIDSIYREHVFELEGFLALLPEGTIALMRQREGIPIGVTPRWPGRWLICATRQHESYELPEMELISAIWLPGLLMLKFRSKAESVAISVELDFAAERLRFDPYRGLSLDSSRSSLPAIQEELASLRFLYCVLANGHVEIWDAGASKRLGRSETFVPVNVMLNCEWFEKEIAKLEALLVHSNTLASETSEKTIPTP